MRFNAALILLGLSFAIATGQNLAPNPSFEDGSTQPTAWTSGSGTARWENFGHTGSHSVSVSSAGICGTEWRTAECPLQSGVPYVLRLWGLATNATTRQAFFGLGTVANRYFTFENYWAPYALVTVLPEGTANPLLRFGQCPVHGTLVFDDVEVRPALPVQMQLGNLELGIGEKFRTGHYTFQTQLSGFSANYARSLLRHNTRFDTDRWVMVSNSFVIYRHGFDSLFFTNAQIKATINWWMSGDLIAEVSADENSWQEAGRVRPATLGWATTVLQTNIPTSFLPAPRIYVRLRATGDLAVNSYRFEGDLPGGPVYADGNTWFFEQQVPGSAVVPLTISDSPTGFVLTVELRNPNAVTRQLALKCQADGPAGTRGSSAQAVVSALSTNHFDLPLPNAGSGPNTIQVEIVDSANNSLLSQGSLQLWVSAIRDSSFGQLLPGTTNCGLWWCDGTYKVGRDRSLPAEAGTIQISAARNEYEPFQIVLRPSAPLANLQVSISDFVCVGLPDARRIPSTNVQVAIVEYVPVTEPTDTSGALGQHPDPLVPLTGAFDVPAKTNQPIWFTVYVPKDTPPGDYEANVMLHSSELAVTVPVRLHVFDFALSDANHTRTAYNVRVDRYWHHLDTIDQEKAVWDLYMEDFRRHRISPYTAHAYAPINWSYDGQYFFFDFGAFDAAMTRYLDEFQFNGFNLMSIPNFLGGYERFTPGYRQLFGQLMPPIMAHLREKGWLEKAYCYWYDEPQSYSFPFVLSGMQAVREAAPGLRRLLTLYPETTMYNEVDIWVPMLNSFDSYVAKAQVRQTAGDDFWWYVCTEPDAPFPNNYIDHPAINPRLRLWLAEKYDVRGELYWNTTYYLGLDGLPRNPWTNAMSPASTGWSQGNGDGLLLYPVARTPPTAPVLAGPVDSLRWEMLREANEDGEYFWLLKQGLLRAQSTLGVGSPAVAEGYAARNAALGLVPGARTFERDPQKLYAARTRLAHAIEALDDRKPFIVTQPGPQAAPVGASAVFRVEALGWPLPAYQWRFNGTTVEGATNSSLALTGVNLSQAGEYDVLVSNAGGGVVSDSATLAVLLPATNTTQLPQLLAQPLSQVRRSGERLVLAVTAVSSTPMSYSWFLNGLPIPGATNAALALTNLTVNQLGDYSVVVSNVAGVVTSATAAVDFPSAPIVQATWAGNGVSLQYLAYDRPSNILVSTNLADWTELYRLLPQSDPVRILDSIDGAGPRRFYRVRVDW
jgi:hypothetical protein